MVLHPSLRLDFRLAPFGVLGFGLLVSVAAQMGDLVESLLKREAGSRTAASFGHGEFWIVRQLVLVMPLSYVLLGVLLTWAPR
jgi:phosphatidate cytidylyltransferase